MWRAGDIGAERNNSKFARLIQVGQWLRPAEHKQIVRGRGLWRWNHIFIVTDSLGNTIEAIGCGVSRGSVVGRQVINLGCPAGVDRLAVVGYAARKLRTPYSWFGVFLMAVDCILGTRLHTSEGGPLFCSELGVQALQAGGWRSPLPASLTKPADLVAELGTDPPIS